LLPGDGLKPRLKHALALLFKGDNMTIIEFRDKLASALSSTPIPEEIRTEKDFEKRFVIPVVLQFSAYQTDIGVYCHPWNNKIRCKPDCQTAPNYGQMVAGCPRCWAESKKWASVLAFGTHNTFDLVAKDASGKTLAVEIKLVAAKGGRMPNGEIQRLMGQGSLAKTKHDSVVGVCGYRGNLDTRWDKDTESVKSWSAGAGIRLIFRAVG
jgi:hypothetical protein